MHQFDDKDEKLDHLRVNLIIIIIIIIIIIKLAIWMFHELEQIKETGTVKIWLNGLNVFHV